MRHYGLFASLFPNAPGCAGLQGRNAHHTPGIEVYLLAVSAVSFGKSEKVDLADEKIDFVAVRGTPFSFEYFIDRKAKLCFAVRAQALANVPCEALLQGYPDLAKIITWHR